MKTRLTGGLAAAALLTAGLACTGSAATAADVTGYPHTLDFSPQRLVAEAGAVYAAGVDDDGTGGYVAEVGGGAVALETGAEQVYGVDLAPDGDSLFAVVSTDDGYHAFTIDAATLAATPTELPSTTRSIDVLGSDAVGSFQVLGTPEQAVVLDADAIADVQLDDDGSAVAAAAIGAVGHREWFVGGTHFTGPSSGVARLWSHEEAGGTTSAPVTLGPAGDPDESVLDVVADATTDTVYALSFQNQDDGPQTYGLSVVHDGAATYYPLAGLASDLALSADGHTLFMSAMGNLVALDAQHLAAEADVADDVRGTYLDSGSISDLAVDPAGHLFVAADHDVVAFSEPGQPTGLVFSGEPDFPAYGSISWTAPTTVGGTEADYLSYEVTLTDRAGGAPLTRRVYGTSQDFDTLVVGHTYDLNVAADNGVFVGAPATTTFTVASTPSAVTVSGTAKVGSRLSVRTTGSWTPGTALSYRWSAGSAVVSTAPTLTVTPAMVGKRVVVAVSGTLGTAAPTTRTSAPVTVAKGTLSAAKPRITGKAKVGKTLSAAPGRWTRGTKLSYSWSADGKKIAKATKRTLRLTKALKGKRVTVAVTGRLPGYATRTIVSAATRKVGR